jgi:hypothetical protein
MDKNNQNDQNANILQFSYLFISFMASLTLTGWSMYIITYFRYIWMIIPPILGIIGSVVLFMHMIKWLKVNWDEIFIYDFENKKYELLNNIIHIFCFSLLINLFTLCLYGIINYAILSHNYHRYCGDYECKIIFEEEYGIKSCSLVEINSTFNKFQCSYFNGNCTESLNNKIVKCDYYNNTECLTNVPRCYNNKNIILLASSLFGVISITSLSFGCCLIKFAIYFKNKNKHLIINDENEKKYYSLLTNL